jgi:CHASE3 domain sensor protein
MTAPGPRTVGRKLPLAIVSGALVAIVAVVATGVLASNGLRQLSVADRWVDHTYEVMNALSRSATHLAEADAGARAYALSGSTGSSPCTGRPASGCRRTSRSSTV